MSTLPPEHAPDQWIQVAQEQIASGNPGVAAQILRRVLRAYPEHAEAHATLAVALLAMNQYKTALNEAQLAVQCNPEDAFAYFVLGLVLKALGRYTEAQSALYEALRLAPEYSQPYAHLADLAAIHGRWAQARDYALRALALDPDLGLAKTLLANALCMLEQPDEAEAVARDALRKNPEDADAHIAMAQIALQRRQPRRAWDYALDALAIDPTHREAQAVLLQAAGLRSPLMRLATSLHLGLMRLPVGWRIATVVLFYMILRLVSEMRHLMPGDSALSPIVSSIAIALALFWLYLVLAPPLFHAWVRRSRDRRLREAARQVRNY